MKTKTLLRSLALATLGAAPLAPLHGFMEIAGGELIFRSTVRVGYDSNLSARADGESDYYYSFIPGLEYLRTAGRANIRGTLNFDITQFNDVSGENFENFNTNWSVSYPVVAGSPLSGGFNFSYAESSDANEFLNLRVKSTTWGFGTNAAYQLRPRMSLRAGAGHNRSTTSGFSSTRSTFGSAGLGFREIYGPIGGTVDFRYRVATTSGRATGASIRNKDGALLFGLSGQLLPPRLFPNLDATLTVGYQNTRGITADGRSSQRLIFNGGLVWPARPRTTLSLNLSRDLDLTPDDRTVEVTSLRFGVNHTFDPKISGSFGAFHNWNDYRGFDRSDRSRGLNAGLSYTFTRRWSANAQAGYTKSSSDVGIASFSRKTASISTTFAF